MSSSDGSGEEFPPLGATTTKTKASPHPKSSPNRAGGRKQRGGGAKGKKWAAPATPIFQNPNNNTTNQSQIGGDTPAKQLQTQFVEEESNQNATATSTSTYAPTSDILSSPSLKPSPASPIKSPSAEAEATTATPSSTNPPRRMSAIMQAKIDNFERLSRGNSATASREASPGRDQTREKVDYYERMSQRNSPDGSPVRSASKPPRHSIIANSESPIAALNKSGVASPQMDLDPLLVSPILAAPSSAAIRASPASTSEAEFPVEVGNATNVGTSGLENEVDADESLAYFQSNAAPVSVDRISFGAMPTEEDVAVQGDRRGTGSTARFLSPSNTSLLSQDRSSLGVTSASGGVGSILSSLNRPSFLGSEDGDRASVGRMDDSRTSGIVEQSTIHSPQSVAAGSAQKSARAGGMTSRSQLLSPNYSTTASMRASPSAAGTTVAASSNSAAASPAPNSTATATLHTPTEYYASRSAPLGAISASKLGVHRPTFNTPPYVTASTSTPSRGNDTTIFSPVNIAPVLREATPNSSRLTSPDGGALSTSAAAAALNASARKSTGSTFSGASPSATGGASRIPRLSGIGTSTPSTISANSIRTSGAMSRTSQISPAARAAAEEAIATVSPRTSSVHGTSITPMASGTLTSRLTSPRIFASPTVSNSGVLSSSSATRLGSSTSLLLSAGKPLAASGATGLFGGVSPSPIHPLRDSTQSPRSNATNSSSSAAVVALQFKSPITPRDTASRLSIGSSAALTRSSLTMSAVKAAATIPTISAAPVSVLNQTVDVDAPFTSVPWTILISSRLHHLHRCVLFEVREGVDARTLQAAVDTWVENTASVGAPALNSKLQKQAPRSGVSNHAWNLTLVFELNDTNIVGLKSEAWIHEFIHHIAKKYCKQQATSNSRDQAIAAASTVRFVEQRPSSWHSQL